MNNLRIRRMRNRWRGQRCFVVGNGPSLDPDDLDALAGEFTFASNKIYKIFPRTVWRPTAYMVVDDVVLRQNLAEINHVRSTLRFGLACHRSILDAAGVAITGADLATAFGARPRILMSMGCHTGLPVDGDPAALTSNVANAAGAAFVATTGYGYGDDFTVGLHERLLSLVGHQLDGTLSLGMALVAAKQEYFATSGLYGPYDEKVIESTVLEDDPAAAPPAGDAATIGGPRP